MTTIPILKSTKFDCKRLRPDMDDALNAARLIIDDVKMRGDEALTEYTKRFDGVYINELKVSEEEIREAYFVADEAFVASIRKAMDNVEKFQKVLLKEDVFADISDGIRLRSLVRPIDNIGAYVPGGTASYVSTAYMIGIPATIAGCRRRIVFTPPNKYGKINPYLIVACDMAGFSEIYKAGGAQAIAAMAYGTESAGKVEKIFGPGNVFVNAAKMIVRDDVAVDMVAGPSEVMIIADESCNPAFVAADMLSQAEHDALSTALLLTDSRDVADAVKKEIDSQLNELLRKDIARKALKDYGKIVVCESIDECIDIANEFAPEHLEIATKDAEDALSKIRNAGSVFLGNLSSVVMGDYATGTNHVLPTMGFAKSMSGLSVDDFVRRMEVSSIGTEGLADIGQTIVSLSELEGLFGHANAVKLRMDKMEESK
ncbi:MAG: histidinol dehydrogenase [archaeon]